MNDKEVTFHIYYSKKRNKTLEKHADLIGHNGNNYYVYALINIDVVSKIAQKKRITHDDKTNRVGGWRYFNNVTWDKGWAEVWDKYGPFKTASYE